MLFNNKILHNTLLYLITKETLGINLDQDAVYYNNFYFILTIFFYYLQDFCILFIMLGVDFPCSYN
jgi:hypothetical protein